MANLSALARMLSQALGQIDSFVTDLAEGDHLQSDKGADDLPNRLAGLHMWLSDAQGQAKALMRALEQAHQLLGPLSYKD